MIDLDLPYSRLVEHRRVIAKELRILQQDNNCLIQERATISGKIAQNEARKKEIVIELDSIDTEITHRRSKPIFTPPPAKYHTGMRLGDTFHFGKYKSKNFTLEMVIIGDRGLIAYYLKEQLISLSYEARILYDKISAR